MNNLLKEIKIELLQQVIICRNFEKEIIGIYKSVDDAADDFLIDTQEIFDAIESKKQLLGSGFWSRCLMVLGQPAKKKIKYETIQNRGKHRHPTSSVSVVQLDYETMAFIARFDSMYEAFSKTGARNISMCCKGKAQSSGGFRWMFESEYNAMINDNNEIDDLM